VHALAGDAKGTIQVLLRQEDPRKRGTQLQEER